MKIRTTKVPIRMGKYTYRLREIKVGCRFGIRLLIYFVLLIFVGPYFGNWTTTEKFLCRLDIFAGECSIAERLGPASDSFRCAAQRFKIAKLGSIVRLSVLTIGFALGLLLDILGPKITFILGIAMRISSWLIFSVRNVRDPFVIASSVLLGLSRNAIAYPTLTIYMYTTSFKEYATTIMGIGITLAGLYIIVIERLMGFTRADPYKFTLYSTLATHLPCLLIGLVIFPWKSPTPKVKQRAAPAEAYTDAQSSTDDDSHPAAPTAESSNALLEAAERVSKLSASDDTLIQIDRSEPPSAAESDVDVDADVQTEIPIDNSNWKLGKFVRYLRSTEYLITCPYFVLNFLDFFFMQVMFSTMYGRYKDVMTLNEYLVSFSFILTFLIGFLYKVFSPVTILIFSNFFGIVTHFVAFSGSRVAGYLAASTLIVYASILFTQTYIYVQSTFDAKYFGSLIGTINTFAGFVMFFNIVLISLVENYGCINHIHVAMIVARAVCEGFLVYLNLRRRKRTKSI